jgi:PD-(D/E)XK endonuclease
MGTPDRQRLLSRTRQGDLGEASAIEWFTRIGAVVFAPVGHSPDADLIALLDNNAVRVQVKTSTQSSTTRSGGQRYPVLLATRGGNRSWNRTVKRIDPQRIDYLFVLTVTGRRWCIPAAAIEAANAISLGGPKYSEFEVDATSPIHSVVYSQGTRLDCQPRLGEYPSGQRMATVNRPAQPSQVRILPPPLETSRFRATKYERKLGKSGQALINPKRRVTLPHSAVSDADLRIGDRLRVSAAGYGRIVIERIELPAPAQPELPAA